jgi:cytochrome P450
MFPGALPSGPDAAASVQSVVFARDPVGALLRCRARYGPIFTLRFPTLGPVVVVASPEHAIDLILADPKSAHAGEARRAVLPQASPLSSFGADDAQHCAARARISPAMVRERVERLSGDIVSIAARHVDRWPIGTPTRVLARMRTLCEEIFVRLILGVEDERRADEIVGALGRLIRTPGNPPLLPPARDQGPLGSLVDIAFRHRAAPLIALLTDEIETRSPQPKAGDIIAHIATADPSLDSRQIAEELLVVLAAAQEPPAIALTWIIEFLSRNRGLGERFLEGGEDRRAAIANEVLRLRPPALASLRRLTTTRDVGDHELPAGTDVMVSIPLVHRDPVAFANPGVFEADRFLAATSPYFIPFGDGVRGCPGQHLARIEIQAVVPLVLERLRLRFPRRPEHPVQRATVLVPNRSGLAVGSAPHH